MPAGRGRHRTPGAATFQRTGCAARRTAPVRPQWQPSSADSEDGAFWTAFLRSLKARDMSGVRLVIADAHLGLRQDVNAVFLGAEVQRCRVHFPRNMLAQVPRGNADMVAAAICTG